MIFSFINFLILNGNVMFEVSIFEYCLQIKNLAHVKEVTEVSLQNL